MDRSDHINEEGADARGKVLGPMSVNPEFGYVFREYNDTESMYGLALGDEASDDLELLAEISGTADQDFDDDELALTIGARWEPSATNVLLI